jgi:CRISPR-associated endonuclease Cas1
MAATKTIAHRVRLREFGTPEILAAAPRSAITPHYGVVTLFGYGVQVRVDRGHLILEDGIGADRRGARLPRVGHGLRRLVVIGADGMVTLAALRWLADQEAAFVMLERDGSVLATTGPVSPSDARLRRAQACARDSGAALQIARELIDRKLAGQEQLVRETLRDAKAGETIAAFRARLTSARTIEAILQIELHAALMYWSVWHDLPVSFPRADLPRVPDHWLTFNARQSPLSRSPRLAANPPNAMLNYLYAILAAEARLAVAAMGLDPGLGFLHFDEATRDSLAYDLMEPVRPQVDGLVLDWIRRAPVKRDWFFEQRDGTCRLMALFAAQLSETAPMWRRAIAPLAEWVAHTLSSSIRKRTRKLGPTTRLTRRRSREAQGSDSLPPPEPSVRPQGLCRFCGITIEPERSYCSSCAVAFSTEQIKKAAPSGWIATQGANAQALRAKTQRRNAAARKAWDSANLPSWLNEDAYQQRIQPLLAGVSAGRIASALSVSWMYAAHIRRGKRRPHPRHWQKLADLVSVRPSVS